MRQVRVCVLVDQFPVISETFITAELAGLRRAGARTRVEAFVPADPPADNSGDDASFWTADSLGARLRALVWLAARHPVGCARDLAAQRRWRREESVLPLRVLAPVARRIVASGDEHLHAHFARGAALSAMRLARILGLPFSVTAHAYDIYLSPANLEEKLVAARFATSGCDYTVATLRERAPAARVERIIMGIDPESFTPPPPRPGGGRAVLTVGRLVEKKGFADLIRAAAALQRAGRPLERLTIAGDGPLRARLDGLARDLGVEDTVTLTGAVAHEHVARLLLEHDVFCLPCVVAPDGDRDSQPVVVKEALAMCVPVVVTDEVGLPEIVRPQWGRLVPPHEPEALAEALDAVLALSASERRAMGDAGREFVVHHCNVWTESARLADLIAGRA